MTFRDRAIFFTRYIYDSARFEFAHVLSLYFAAIVAIVLPSKKTFARVQNQSRAGRHVLCVRR